MSLAAALGLAGISTAHAQSKQIVYLTPGLDLPFWRYLSKGVEAAAKEKGYGFQALDSRNSAADPAAERAGRDRQRRRRHRHLADRFVDRAEPCSSWPKKANIPVVIADIGTNSGDYVSFIISDNYEGAEGRRRGAGRGDEGEGLGQGLGRARHHLAGAQERPGPHQGLP